MTANVLSSVSSQSMADPASFDQRYAGNDDPWHIDHRWYERRKRAVLLASLPRERFGLILEPGCGSGTLSAALAGRCDRLVACDISPRAIALAAGRLHGNANVSLSCQQIPTQWPLADGMHADCIVVSELGYYLAAPQFAQLAARIASTLADGGILVACHWKGAFDERTMQTPAMHDRLQASLGLASLVRHEEPDFLLDVWSADPRSVATHEGFA